MKKRIALLLATLLVLSLAMPAFAADGVRSASARKESATATADLPVVVEDSVKLTPVDEELGEEEAKEMKEAFDALKEATPEKFKVQYFCYATAEKYPCKATVEIENAKEVILKAFIDGEWVEIEVTDNGDGTYTFELKEDCPIAFFTK